MPRVRRPMPSARIAAPRRSGRPSSGSRASSRMRIAANAVARPIGTLTRKIQCQLSWTRRPPIGGPRAAATPETADQMPIATGRCSGGKAGSRRPSVVGIIIAAPTAWRTRAPTRKGIEGEIAQSAEAADEGEQADDEDALAADPVGDPPGRDQQRGEDDRVAVQDPGEARQRGVVEGAREVGEGDVDDEQVEAGHEEADRGDCEHLPAVCHFVAPVRRASGAAAGSLAFRKAR